jgi:hypothetical protein
MHGSTDSGSHIKGAEKRKKKQEELLHTAGLFNIRGSFLDPI